MTEQRLADIERAARGLMTEELPPQSAEDTWEDVITPGTVLELTGEVRRLQQNEVFFVNQTSQTRSYGVVEPSKTLPQAIAEVGVSLVIGATLIAFFWVFTH